MVKTFGKLGFLVCLLFCLASCQINPNAASTDPVVYTWPTADSLSTDVTYDGEGEIRYVHTQTSYADVSGIYEDVGHWTVYIENAELLDVENYIAQLKAAGYSYFGFAGSQEPSIEYTWTGFFAWDGHAEKGAVRIYLNKEKAEMRNREINEVFYYHLRVDLIDDDVWKTYDASNNN